MVFSTEGKRDQHIKYSPAHAPPAEESGLQPARESTMNSITIYSGTKLFWRTRLNVELFMQQHELASAVQVSEKSRETEIGGGRERGGVMGIRMKGGARGRGSDETEDTLFLRMFS